MKDLEIIQEVAQRAGKLRALLDVAMELYDRIESDGEITDISRSTAKFLRERIAEVDAELNTNQEAN